MGNKHLTIFAFSAKNWKCAQSEVSGLMCLFKGHIMVNLTNALNGILKKMKESEQNDADISVAKSDSSESS